MKTLLVLILTLVATVGFAQTQTQTPLTKEQIEARLQAVQVEKRYLELQVQEQQLKQALENLKKDAPKPAPEKKEKK